ncbi:MAG: leucine-rich repeat domain-containing protein, partial [Prevotella sp.]|nr:leucine-rich repeat domain-containing protein [Prevotella sp.]
MRKFFILFFLLSLFGYTSYSQTTFEKDSLRYTLNTDGTATVSSCLYLSTSEITIPQNVNDGTQDYTVTKIGDSAFYGKSFVTSVTFPSTLTTFGRYSFSRTGLTSVVIPEGVTTLTFELFSYCDQLTSVTIPEGVTTMERGVFYEDDLLNGVVLPSTLTTIGYHAFGRCIGLTAITIPANVSVIDAYAFQYCSNLETVDLKPQTMTTIGQNAFDSCEKLTAFHVPEGITTLGQEVFYGCKAMQELSLPSTLTSIGYRTFYNCISLPSVTIPEGVTTIGNEAFRYCKLLGGDITLPAALTSLGSYAFAGCENVERVTFLGNNDVTMPGESQFSSMKKLKSVKLPDNLSTITTSMFFGCNQLQSIDLSRLTATVISPWAFRLCQALASVQLPPGTATIGNEAFAYCENLTAISFPSTLKSIGNNAFDNNNLTSLQLNDGLETIGNYAFSGSKDLSASPVVIPQSVTSIGGSAFYNCDQMTSFTFPESLTTLDTYVLAGCDNLQTVVFPRNMTTIPRSTCEGCKRLANVTLPENVVTIGLQAFYGATSLPAITLPATVKTIEDNAFRDTNIPSLTLNEGLETIGASAFNNCDRLKTLNIPSTVKNIGNYAFYNCDSILAVTFPEDMTALNTIGTNLFAYNKWLTKVTLPKTGMSSIPNYMFQECDRLRNIQLPATITSIGDHAFYSCDSLQTIYIPDGVKSIGYETFCYCKGLRYVRLPEGLESIGQSCFAYTEKLPFINIPSTVTSMGNWAIHTTASSSNTNFKSIGIMGSTMPGTKDHVFWQYQPAFSLLVPAGQESDYQNSTSWTPDATDNRTIKGYPAEKQTLTQDLIHLSCLDKESYKSGSPEAVWIDWFEGMGNYRIWYTDTNGNKTATMPTESGDYTISADFEEGPYYKPATFDNIATFSLKEIANEDFALLWDFYSKTYDRTKQKSTWAGSGGGGAPANWGLIEGVKESAVGIFGVKWNNGHVEEINFGTGTSIYNLNAEETPVSLFALPQVKKIEIAG